MKKFMSVIFIAMLIMTLAAVTAFADANNDLTDYKFGFSAGTTTESSADFGYSENYKKKLSSSIDYIEVRYSVSESAVSYTNLFAARKQGGNYIGSKWIKPNVGYMPTNGGCSAGAYYAPCGRGNSKYSKNLGITQITVNGQFKVH